MPEVGDSALIHYYGGETTSDSHFGAWQPDLDDSYKHTHFVMRAAWNGNVSVPSSPSVFFENNDAGSFDTGAHYNRGIGWGYGGNRYAYGDNRQTYGILGALPFSTGGTASFTDDVVGWTEGTIWNHSVSDAATTITFRSGAHNTASTTSSGATVYNYFYWGWVNYRVETKATQIHIGSTTYNLVEGSRLDLWGVRS